MTFIIEKDPGLIPQILSRILDSCVNGVTMVDPDLEDMPLIYATKAVENVTAYTKREIIWRNCRFLQGANREQWELLQLRQAIYNCQPVELTIKNYRKNGELLYNHPMVTPLLALHGMALYFLGVQYDLTQRIHDKEKIKQLTDRLESLRK